MSYVFVNSFRAGPEWNAVSHPGPAPVNTAQNTLSVDISKPVFAMAESNEICKKNAVCNIMNYSTKISQISLHKVETMS